MNPSRLQRLLVYGLLLPALLLFTTWTLGWFQPLEDELATWKARASPDAPTVVMVVLDNVRADHLSACGYNRPTSPTLERLVEDGASFTCDAYAPGSWTLPSHASFFTGTDVPTHHAHRVTDGVHLYDLPEFSHSRAALPLGDELPTLAQQMTDAGYQSVAVSANPVVSPATDLARGFSIFRFQKGRFLPGEEVLDELRTILRERLDTSGPPLFLFVNIMDAHNPWRSIPAGLGWVEQQDGFGLYDAPMEDSVAVRYLEGRMSPHEAARTMERIVDAYDYGIHVADRTLGQVLEMLQDHGWARKGMRLVVTSDHGEMLGEQGLLDHGRYLWQGIMRVPLLYWQKGREREQARLPRGPLSAVQAYHLALDGTCPAESMPVRSVAYPDMFWMELFKGRYGTSTWASVVEGSTKLLWRDGKLVRYDLDSDPAEEHPLDAAGSAALPRIRALVSSVQQEQTPRDLRPSQDMLQALRAMGYLD